MAHVTIRVLVVDVLYMNSQCHKETEPTCTYCICLSQTKPVQYNLKQLQDFEKKARHACSPYLNDGHVTIRLGQCHTWACYNQIGDHISYD